MGVWDIHWSYWRNPGKIPEQMIVLKPFICNHFKKIFLHFLLWLDGLLAPFGWLQILLILCLLYIALTIVCSGFLL